MRKYLFIDGGYFEMTLRGICKSAFANEDVMSHLDFRQISSQYDRVFYYDSLPAKKDNQSDTEHQSTVSRKQRIFDMINESPKSLVRGAFSKYARRPNRQEQKGVDVLMAIDILQHAYRDNVDKVTILTGDLDFLPLFDALIQTRVTSELIYNKESVASELVQSADISRAIRFHDLGVWLRDPIGHRFRTFGSRSIKPSGRYDIVKEIPNAGSILKFVKIRDKEEYVVIIEHGDNVNCYHAGGLEVLCEQTGVSIEDILS